MKTVLSELEMNRMLTPALREELGKVMAEFKETEIYKILTLLNENDIKSRLTLGKGPGLSSDEAIGIMQGIQIGFESRIESCISDGLIAKNNIKAEKEFKKEQKEDEGLENQSEQDADAPGIDTSI